MILHMETETVRAFAEQLRRMVDQTYEHAGGAEDSHVTLSDSWEGNSRERFADDMGAALRALHQLAEEGNQLAGRLHREVDEWERVDSNGVDNLFQISIRFTPNFDELMARMASVAVPLVGGGAVLGASVVSSVTQSSQDYAHMTYAERYRALQDLHAQEDSLNRQIAELDAQISADNASLEEINQKIAELQAEQARLSEELGKWENELIPDTPFAFGDGDGVFWRTKNDDIEDQLDAIRNQLKDLYAQRGQLERAIATQTQVRTSAQSALIDTQHKITALKPLVGDVNKIWTHQPANPNTTPHKGYCLAYVQAFRGADTFPKRLAEADMLVTDPAYAKMRYDLPAGSQDLRFVTEPGHLVVWEAGELGANATAGHVAIITEVYADHVVVMESSWDGKIGQPRSIPLSKLQQLTFIGYPN